MANSVKEILKTEQSDWNNITSEFQEVFQGYFGCGTSNDYGSGC